MRTNIVINDDVLAEALRLTKLRTKREVVDLALRRLVLLERQKDVLALEGSVAWEGDLDELRLTRRSPDAG